MHEAKHKLFPIRVLRNGEDGGNLNGSHVQARQSDEEEESGEDQAEEEEEEEEEAEQGRKKYQLRERRPIQQANLYQPSFGGQGTR